MKRPGWEFRLREVMAPGQRFDWLSLHCGLFAAAAVDAQLGTGYADRLRKALSQYRTEEEVLRFLEEQGGLQAIVTSWLGQELAPINSLTRGDIALYRHPWQGGQALAVHDGHQLLAPDYEGLTAISFGLAVGGWRVR